MMRISALRRTGFLSLVLILLLCICSCQDRINDWVYFRTTVTAFPSEADSLSGAALAKKLDKSVYAALGESLYALVYDSKGLNGNVTDASDEFYTSCRDTVTASYVLSLEKVFSVADMKGMKRSLRKYSFNHSLQ